VRFPPDHGVHAVRFVQRPGLRVLASLVGAGSRACLSVLPRAMLPRPCAMRLAYRPNRVSGLMASTGSSASGATCLSRPPVEEEKTVPQDQNPSPLPPDPEWARQLFAAATRSVHHRRRQYGRPVKRLSGRERQVLDSIAEGLARSDPHLEQLLATFTRLASGERMPLRDQRSADPRRAIRRPPARRCRSGRSRPRSRFMLRRPSLLHAAALMYVLVIVALVVSAMVLSHGSSHGGCPSLWAPPCVKAASAPGSRPAAHGRPVSDGDSRYASEGTRP
jgi:hypothetical protein